jgi:hypothetical protein
MKMALNDVRPCPCGSGKPSTWISDAKGIPLIRACCDCREGRLKEFRPEVLTNPNYDTTEPVEPDDGTTFDEVMKHFPPIMI